MPRRAHEMVRRIDFSFHSEFADFCAVRDHWRFPRGSTVLNRIREIVKWGGSEALSFDLGDRPALFVAERAGPRSSPDTLGGLRCTRIFAADARNALRGLYWKNGRSPCICCIDRCGRARGIRCAHFATRHSHRNDTTSRKAERHSRYPVAPWKCGTLCAR